jgi:hypothetical protein
MADNPQPEGMSPLYASFLKGDTGVGMYEDIADMTDEGEDIRYLLSDITNDGVPELFLRTDKRLYILSIDDGDLKLWKSYAESTLLANGAILHRQHRGWGDVYTYRLLNVKGEIRYSVRFEKRRISEGFGITEKNRYVFDGVGNLTKDVWDTLTKRYLDTEEVVWLSWH